MDDGDGVAGVGQRLEAVQTEGVVVHHGHGHADGPDGIGRHAARTHHVDGEHHHCQQRGDNPIARHGLVEIGSGLEGGDLGHLDLRPVREPMARRSRSSYRDRTVSHRYCSST
jgi:hypothetical protein